MKKAMLVAVVAALFILAGCKGGGYSEKQASGSVPSGADPAKTAAAAFKKDVQPIFTKNCAHPSCHGAAQSAGMQLSPGLAYENIVNVHSSEVPALMRIKPGEPDSSYLVMKIEGKQEVGAQMPLTGGPLPNKDIQTIRSWVEAGAKND
jgi:hypothetical protein